jgi:hypothetical protein
MTTRQQFGVQLKEMEKNVYRKICDVCGRANSKIATECFNCNNAITDTIPETPLDNYFCYNCDEANRPSITIINTYYYPLSLSNATLKLCKKCCSQNYKNNKQCLRCDEVLDAGLIESDKLCKDIYQDTDISEPAQITRMCYTCKAPCSSLQVTDIADLCKFCENCGAFTLLSPVISIKDYEFMKSLQSGGMRHRIVIKKIYFYNKENCAQEIPINSQEIPNINNIKKEIPKIIEKEIRATVIEFLKDIL